MQVSQKSSNVVVQRGKLNTVGKIDFGKEFNKTKIAGKKEIPQQRSLDLTNFTQNSNENKTPLLAMECEMLTLWKYPFVVPKEGGSVSTSYSKI